MRKGDAMESDCGEFDLFFKDPLKFPRPNNGENIQDVLKRTRDFWVEKTMDPSLADKTVLCIFPRMCSAGAASESVSGSGAFLAWMRAAQLQHQFSRSKRWQSQIPGGR